MDCCFLKRHGDVNMVPFIVIRDHQTRTTFSHKLLGKSTTDEDYSRYMVHAVMNDLKSLDYKKIVLKSDQEKALVALQERLRQLRNGINEQTILENSPVGESQSNGVVEKAVQGVENLAGTLLSALVERLDIVLPIDSPVQRLYFFTVNIKRCYFIHIITNPEERFVRWMINNFIW